MSTTIKLPNELIAQAKTYSEIFSRSVPKQIEYWSKIGKLAEENPDLPYSFIQGILIAETDTENGDVTPYDFG